MDRANSAKWAIGMLSLTVSPNSEQRLVDQIVAGIKPIVRSRTGICGLGAFKLPSIRNFWQETHSVSRFRTSGRGLRPPSCGWAILRSRRGAGFYTSDTLAPAGCGACCPILTIY